MDHRIARAQAGEGRERLRADWIRRRMTLRKTAITPHMTWAATGLKNAAGIEMRNTTGRVSKDRR